MMQGTQKWINVSLTLTFVTVNGIQTLTNKTMTDNSNNLTSRGLFSDSGSNTVSVFASPNPTSGQVLTATSGTTATWQDVAGDVTLDGVQTLTNKTMTDNTNNLTARGLFSDSGAIRYQYSHQQIQQAVKYSLQRVGQQRLGKHQQVET